MPSSPRFPEASMERKELSIQSSSIRPGNSSKGLYKDSTAPSSQNETVVHTNGHLSGRHFSHGSYQGNADISHGNTCSRATRTRFQTELQKMFLETDTVDRIPGIPSQLHDDDHQFAHRQSPEGDERMQTHDEEVSNSSRSGPLDWFAVFNNTSRHSGTSPLPSSPEASPQNTIKLTRRLRPADSHQRRSRSRSPLVGRKPARISCPAFSRHGSDYRRFKVWLGGNRPIRQHRRDVDSRRENSPHKLSGVESCPTGLANVCLSKAEPSHPIVGEQLISNCLPKPERRNSLQSSIGLGHTDMGVVPNPENNDPCGTHSGHAQHSGGCRVEREHRAERLEIGRESFFANCKTFGVLSTWIFLQLDTTDNSLDISASDQTQKQKLWMPYPSAG